MFHLSGFGMAASQFIFLERNMEFDMESFDQAIDYYTGMGKNYQVPVIVFTSNVMSLSCCSSLRELTNRHGQRRKVQNMRARMDYG